MNRAEIDKFLETCDDLLNCKFLVAEYKIQRLLQQLASASDVCSLVGECLEQFNRDREFAKTFVQDGQGDFVCLMPSEEYKVIALVFCTLVDIENKKIDFVDFIKRFFGREENPFKAFLDTMIVPFKKLIEEAFSYAENDKDEDHHDDEDDEDEDDDDNDHVDDEVYENVQKIAVQILSELQFSRQDNDTQNAITICKAIVKTAKMHDMEVTFSLAIALKSTKVKQIKFYVKEICHLLDL